MTDKTFCDVLLRKLASLSFYRHTTLCAQHETGQLHVTNVTAIILCKLHL
jgi:hypothetical protein